jgi:hypothetical protein
LLGYSGWRAGAKVALRDNLYWRANAQAFDFAGVSWKDWQAKGNDHGSLIADPLFVNPEKRDFRLRPNSPAIKLGFKPFDFRSSGVFGDSAWRKLAQSTPYPPPYRVPEAPPLRISTEFESGSLESCLFSSQIHDEGKPGLLSIVPAPQGTHGRVLKVTDSAELKAGFNPHFYWDPQYTKGLATMKCSLRLEAGADVILEWRDSANPYRVGPSLHFSRGVLSAKGRKLLDIPIDAWMHIEIKSPLGQTNSTWALAVTMPDGKSHAFKNLSSDPAWNAARWIGFSSQGANGTSYYIDALLMEVKP